MKTLIEVFLPSVFALFAGLCIGLSIAGWSDMYKEKDANEMLNDKTYDDFLDFIIEGEKYCDIGKAIDCNPYSEKNYAFRCKMDVFSMLEIEY